MMIYFVGYEPERDRSAVWGRFTAHEGYWQGLSFAEYLLHSTRKERIQYFKVVVFNTPEDHEEYTLQEYYDKFKKEETA